jgi:hypothetical protein
MKRINFKDILARFTGDGTRAWHVMPLHIALLLFFLQPATAQHLATPFSGKLPSEIYLTSVSSENSSSAIITTERNLLMFIPPSGGPPTEDESGGNSGPVGGAPIRDCLWALIFCCLAYGIYCRKNV